MKTPGRTEISIPFGGGEVFVNLDNAEVIAVCGIARHPAISDLGARIREAIAAPIGVPPLSEMARGARRVVVLSDDATRPTPVADILPPLLDELRKSGIPEAAITIVMANGSHRPMTDEELEHKLGKEVVQRFRVVNHDYRAPDLVDLGCTPSGIPIQVSKEVADSDFVIGIGSIVPHRYCGWSGGAKIVQPGVCGEATTVATHLMITRDPAVRLGNAENVVRHEMEEVATRAGLKFIVNVVLNADGQVAGVVAGHPVAAHRAGVSKALEICGARIPERADVVIAGSHPADINFWQAGKALYSADLAVKDGGTIILVSPIYEGIGEHREFGELLSVEYDEITRRLGRGEISDRLSAAGALAVRLVAQRAKVVLVTDGLSEQEVSAMGFVRYGVADLQKAVDDVLASYAGRRCTVTVLREAPEILPLLE